MLRVRSTPPSAENRRVRAHVAIPKVGHAASKLALLDEAIPGREILQKNAKNIWGKSSINGDVKIFWDCLLDI